MGILHRGYVITKRNGKYVASDRELEMTSRYLHRLFRGIDALWQAASQTRSADTPVDLLVTARWVREWIKNPTRWVDLDAQCAAGAG